MKSGSPAARKVYMRRLKRYAAQAEMKNEHIIL